MSERGRRGVFAGRGAVGVRGRRPLSDALRLASRRVDRYVALTSPIGRVFVAFDRQRVTAVMRAASPRAFERAYARVGGRRARRTETRPPWLRSSVAPGARALSPARFDLDALPAFTRAVLCKVLEIPRGQVRTYAWVARQIGRPDAPRGVGSALRRNPTPLLIPCHRVVRVDGRIGPFILGSAAKRALLVDEGFDPDGLRRLARRGVR